MDLKTLPLFTPQLVTSNPSSLLEDLPPFVGPCDLVRDPQTGEALAVVVTFGKKHRITQTLSLLGWALCREATRFNITIVTNADSSKPGYRVYTKFSFPGAPHDNFPIQRLFKNAGANEAVRKAGIQSDLRPDNLTKIGAGSPLKSAVKVIREHVRRAASEQEAAGTFPKEFTKEQYLANFEALLSAVLEETAASPVEGLSA